MEHLAGKVAVVTGGGAGIGLALAHAFAREGMHLVVADVQDDVLAAAEVELRASGAEVLAVHTDVSDPDAVDALHAATLERFGAAHVLCNNAGVEVGAATWELNRAAWQWVVGVNLFGVVNGQQSFLPTMLEQGEGHIVNTASLAGLLALPFSAPYTATKHAVVGLSETLYHELALTGSGVHVSVLCPGWVKTRIFESTRNYPEGAAPPETEVPVARLVEEWAANAVNEGIDPAEVARQVVDAIKAERFWILTHPEISSAVMGRFKAATNGDNPRAPDIV
ncbi:MAG: hypothetical protein JWL73_1368 [Actinomycetia bacterium]|nr:hypothetical protein [Actinomycetes bacterium]